MPAGALNVPQLDLNKTPPIPAWTRNSSKDVLTKHTPSQRGDKMHLIMRRPNPSYASEDTKYILTSFENPYHASKDTMCSSTCIDQAPPMPAKTQSVYKLVLTKKPQGD